MSPHKKRPIGSITRQWAHVQRKVERGICERCTKPVSEDNRRLCDHHRDIYRRCVLGNWLRKRAEERGGEYAYKQQRKK